MLGLLHISLEAHNAAQNHHRAYVVQLGRDLFGSWVVTVSFGRVGSPGRVRLYPFADLVGAQGHIRALLRRRLSAPRRIGCAYVVREASAAPELEVPSWLPLALGPAPEALRAAA